MAYLKMTPCINISLLLFLMTLVNVIVSIINLSISKHVHSRCSFQIPAHDFNTEFLATFSAFLLFLTIWNIVYCFMYYLLREYTCSTEKLNSQLIISVHFYIEKSFQALGLIKMSQNLVTLIFRLPYVFLKV